MGFKKWFFFCFEQQFLILILFSLVSGHQKRKLFHGIVGVVCKLPSGIESEFQFPAT